MMHDKEAKALTGVMKNAILELCRSQLDYRGQLEVDGIICISGEKRGQQIVVKVHEKLFQDLAEKDSRPLDNGQDDALDEDLSISSHQPNPGASKGAVPFEQEQIGDSDDEKASELSKDTDGLAEDLTVKNEPKSFDPEDDVDDMESDPNGNNDSGINMSFYNQHNTDSKLRHLLLANQAAKPYSMVPFYQRRAHFHAMPMMPDCKACGYTFAHSELLREHNEAVHGVFTCNVCFRTFTSRSNLDRHARLHTGHKPYVCTKCGKAFSRKDHLTNHAAKHAFKCGKCLKRFADRESLKSHYVQEHSCVLSNICEHCNKGFTDPKVYGEHVKTHPEVSGSKHPVRHRPFSCIQCSFTCSTRLDLLKHKQIHRDVQIVYSCLACSERFGDPVLYSQHFNGHKNEVGVFECCICRQICKTLQDLKSHEAAHLEIAETEAAKQENYTCPYCSKTFQSDSRLSEHISIHEGYRKFRCGSCDQGFTSPAALKQHEEELTHGPLSLVKTPSSSVSAAEHDQSPTSSAAAVSGEASSIAPAAPADTTSQVPPVPLVDSDDEPIEVVEPEAPDSPEHDDSQYANDFVIHDNPAPPVAATMMLGDEERKAGEVSATKPRFGDTLPDDDENEDDDDPDDAYGGPRMHNMTGGNGSRRDAVLPGTSSSTARSKEAASGGSSAGAIPTSPWMADLHNHNYPGAFGSFFWCSICDAQLASFQECEAHCFTEHYRYPCMYCTKTFAQKANRDRHLCIHTGEKPFACPECDQRFARGDKLKIHRMKWHNIQFSTPYMRMPKVSTSSDQPSASDNPQFNNPNIRMPKPASSTSDQQDTAQFSSPFVAVPKYHPMEDQASAEDK